MGAETQLAQPGSPASFSPPARVVQNHTLDSTRWRDFPFRAGDVVVSSWAKAGTTWLQQIVGQLIFGPRDLKLWDVSPWIDNRLYSRKQLYRRLNLQTHRRFVKSHLPADALPLSPQASYLYIARNGPDVAWSWYHHHRNLTPTVYEVTNSLGGRVGPPLEPPIEPFEAFFDAWLERDGYPLWPFWSHVASWWEARLRPNVLLVHYADLKADLPGQVQRIAAFLDLPCSAADRDEIVRRASFDYMKKNANEMLSPLQTAMSGGASAFLRGGRSGDVRQSLSARCLARYEAEARLHLPEDCRRWLEAGTLGC
jgi:aryl sulfotransferase